MVNLWDVRNTRKSLKTRDLGIHAANTCQIQRRGSGFRVLFTENDNILNYYRAVYPSGDFVIVGCADGSVKVLEGEAMDVKTINAVEQHEDAVNGKQLGHEANSLFTVSTDASLRNWR